MGMDEIQVLRGIEGRLGRLEAYHESQARATSELTANVSRLVDKLDKSDDIAREAEHRAKSAQHQINEMKSTFKWVIGTGISIMGLLIAAVGFLWKVVEG